MSHENDGYYRGTRYDTHLSQETCMYPKGDPRWDGYTGMNCGGFVSHAYMKAGGNLAPIAAEQSHSPWSGGPEGAAALTLIVGTATLSIRAQT